MKLLAVDPGSQTVGLYAPEFVRTLDLMQGEKKVERPERLSRLMVQFAEAMIDAGPVDFVVYEEQFVRGGATTKALFGAVGVIEAVAGLQFAGVVSVPQASLRKWAWGTLMKAGKAKDTMGDKQVYKAVASLYTDTSGFDEHQCDACCVYHFTMENQTNGEE